MSLQAGSIVFSILGDDSKFREVMNNAPAHARKASMAVGAAMTAAGAAITGVATKSVLDFVKVGDEIGKMSTRIGFSTEQLSVWKHAIEQGGGSLQDIEKGSKNLSKTIFEAGQGTQTYVDTLGYLGLSYESLAAMTPEEQFMKSAIALSEVKNETDKAAIAQLLFGRTGLAMLPMLANGEAGIREMAEEAERLGIIFDTSMSDSAQRVADEMDEVKKSIMGVSMDIAQALLPTVSEMLVWIRDSVVAFQAWNNANPELSASIIKMVVAAGGIMTVLGPLLIMLPGLATLWSGIVTVLGLVASAFVALGAAVSAPVLLVVAAVAAIGAAAYGLWAYWDEVVAGLKSLWDGAAAAFWFVFGPIIEAIKWLIGSGPQLSTVSAPIPNQAGPQNFGNNRGNQQNRGGAAGGQNFSIDMTVVSNDPNAASRDIAANLGASLAAAGVGL